SLVRGWTELRTLPARGWAMVTAAAVLIAANWGLFTLTGHGVVHVALLVSAGPVTAVPLLLYGAAARRDPAHDAGHPDAHAPVPVGRPRRREAMPAERWVGFGLVW